MKPKDLRILIHNLIIIINIFYCLKEFKLLKDLSSQSIQLI